MLVCCPFLKQQLDGLKCITSAVKRVRENKATFLTNAKLLVGPKLGPNIYHLELFFHNILINTIHSCKIYCSLELRHLSLTANRTPF